MNYNAMKNHYLLAQIAHTIRQLMENGIEIYKKYKKKLRNISADLYEIFRTSVNGKIRMYKKWNLKMYKNVQN